MLSESTGPTPTEFLRAVFPGLFAPKVVFCTLAAALAALILGCFALLLVLTVKGRLTLASGALLAWGHGAAWLVTGELETLPSAFTNVAGVQWLLFLGLWYAPVVAVWFACISLGS